MSRDVEACHKFGGLTLLLNFSRSCGVSYNMILHKYAGQHQVKLFM